MEDNTESRESKKKSREDNTRSSESKEERRKGMEDNTRPTESESEEDILDEDDEKADKEHDQKLESLVQTYGYAVPRSGAPSLSGIYCGYAVPRSRAPSFFRKAGPRKPREMINHHVEPGQNIVLVRPKPLGQRNPKAPMEGDEEIIEEQAVCEVCFDILREENILKTECKCGNALIHEKCVADLSGTGGNNCDSCGQEVQTFPVTLVRGLSSSTPVIEKKAKKKAKNVFGCFHG